MDWLHTLNAQFGLAASSMCSDGFAQDLQSSFISKTAAFGELATTISVSLSDGKICPREAENIISAARKSQRSSQKIIAATKRALMESS
ncbi:phage regulatory CII family protein [Advenella sp. FME57]|uniref:phage regulatory CII family protein n=1 Tax=Advenella sp. FME57 TaxID=2742604 RepID=UPI00351C553B